MSAIGKRITVNADGCWIWQAATSADGYGIVQLTDMPNTRRAHRVAYELFVGQIPTGLQIDHLCRTPGCINPDHLEPVTPYENVRRSYEARYGRPMDVATCRRGHLKADSNLYTYTYANGKTIHVCRECKRMNSRSARQAGAS